MLRVTAGLLLATAACATPFHLRPVPLRSGGRSLQDLFLGGWDGHRLDVFNDTSVEPGTTRANDLAHTLSYLSEQEYAVAYVDKAALTAEEAGAHGLFCDAPACLVVLDRRGGDSWKSWGAALAIFELAGEHNDPIGAIWLDGRTVRPPGPKSWPLLCRTPADQPHFAHPDGNAYYPARPSPGGDAFALFGANEVTAALHASSFAAPSPTTCVVEPPKDIAPPPPPVPVVAPAPPPAAKPDEGDSSHHSRRKKRKHDE